MNPHTMLRIDAVYVRMYVGTCVCVHNDQTLHEQYGLSQASPTSSTPRWKGSGSTYLATLNSPTDMQIAAAARLHK